MASPELNTSTFVDRILADGKVVEVEEIEQDERVVDAGDAHLLLENPVPAGVRLVGKRSVLIRGDFGGTERSPSVVDVDGDLVVTGSVRHAKLSANRVIVGGAVEEAQVTASAFAAFGGDTRNTKILAGDFERRLAEIRGLEADIERLREKIEVDDRGLRIRQRELLRVSTMSRLNLEVGLGALLQDDGARLYVDLRPFYTIVGDRSEEDLDKAIDEFFYKVVVSTLARGNRQRLVQSAGRQQTFKHLIRQLHELFLATRERDRDTQDLDRLTLSFSEKTAILCAVDAVAAIYGNAGPGTDLHFVRPVVKAGERLRIERETASLSVTVEGDTSKVVAVSADGRKQRLPTLDSARSFRLVDDDVSITPIE